VFQDLTVSVLKLQGRNRFFLSAFAKDYIEARGFADEASPFSFADEASPFSFADEASERRCHRKGKRLDILADKNVWLACLWSSNFHSTPERDDAGMP
jgi:hypothetical protein